MVRRQTPIHKSSKKRGRPQTTRIADVERDAIRKQIEDACNSLSEFYKDAFAEAGESKYRGFKQPSDVETVKSAFVHFFSGSRPLPKLYWKVLENLLGIPDGMTSSSLDVSVERRRTANPQLLPEPARQLAYTFFMDMTNRKVALPIDWKDDTLSDVYASWKRFFDNSVSLLKNFPVEQATESRPIIHLLQEILHQVLRPHLTRWQAAYRRWYETNHTRKELRNLRPQEVQRHFPDFAALRNDFEATQGKVRNYAQRLEGLIYLAK